MQKSTMRYAKHQTQHLTTSSQVQHQHMFLVSFDLKTLIYFVDFNMFTHWCQNLQKTAVASIWNEVPWIVLCYWKIWQTMGSPGQSFLKLFAESTEWLASFPKQIVLEVFYMCGCNSKVSQLWPISSSLTEIHNKLKSNRDFKPSQDCHT